MRRLDQRPAGEDEDERRQEGEEGDHRRAERRRRGPARRARSSCLVQPPTKPTKATTMISGPGVVSPSARPSIICAAGEPVVVLDRALVDVGQHRVGAAEGQQRRLGEEPAHLRQRRRPTRSSDRAAPCAAPTARARRPTTAPARAPARSARAAGVGVSSSMTAGAVALPRRAVAAADARTLPARASRRASRASAAPSTISGNGTSNAKMRDEGRRGDRPQQPVLQRARADAPGRVHARSPITAGLMP